MVELIGTSPAVFIGLTVGVMGFASYVTGQALAKTWRPAWHAVPYCLLITCADRFLTFGLFQGQLLLLSGYLIDFGVLLGLALLAYRLTQARKMVAQYPWIYERRGPFSWREKS